MSDRIDVKLCAVCGDEAIGKHFGALACKSCKPFFRRNALKNKVFKCKTNDNCVINRTTRKSCRKCRLNKCLSVGMKKESIRNEEQKYSRRLLVEENRKKRQNNSINTDSNDSKTSSEIYKSYDNSDEEIDSQDTRNCVKLSFIDKVFNDFRRDSNASHSSEQIVCKSNKNKDFLNELFEDNSVSEELVESEIQEIVSYIEDNNEITGQMNTNVEYKERALDVCHRIERPFIDSFQEVQHMKLLELSSVTKMFTTPLSLGPVFKITNIDVFNGVYNEFCDKEIRNVITLSKNLSTFQNICENDKIALVKYGCIDIICLRSLSFYNKSNEYWNIFLLMAIVLYNPDRQYLQQKDVIKFQQNLYLYLLQRYLSLKYVTEWEAQTKFGRLLLALGDIYQLGKCQLNIVYQEDPKIFGPLVYKCYFDEKCKLDSVTRKFCRRCRLRKCFEIGMKQEWILNDEEKQVRRKKIEEKRSKKRKNSVQSSSSETKSTS
ncbi:unnamed protein product, partial [Oppiella nova]